MDSGLWLREPKNDNHPPTNESPATELSVAGPDVVRSAGTSAVRSRSARL